MNDRLTFAMTAPIVEVGCLQMQEVEMDAQMIRLLTDTTKSNDAERQQLIQAVPLAELIEALMRRSQPELVLAAKNAIIARGKATEVITELQQRLMMEKDVFMRQMIVLTIGTLAEYGGREILQQLRREHTDPQIRIAAMRALTNSGHNGGHRLFSQHN